MKTLKEKIISHFKKYRKMEKKEFLDLTAKLFQEYGFLKFGNQYFLNLERVVIRVYRMGARFEDGAYSYQFTCCFKDIHEDYVFETKEDYKNMPEDLCFLKYLKTSEKLRDQNGEKYNVWAFYPENYTEKKWRKLFAEMMKKYFDPFLQDFEKHVREEYSREQTCGINITAYKKCKEKGIIFR